VTHDNLEVVYGPPGTGKTSYALGIVQRELESGTPPDRIGFLAFTKKAAREATERACERFNYKPEELPFFRTIHSLCFQRLNLRPDRVMQKQHFSQLGESWS
jgi:superfamily I DNA/RNA helicase